MQFRNDDMSLWFGTDDAPAPGEVVLPGDKAKMTLGVRPRHSGNVALVRYRVNGGNEQSLRAYEAPGKWSADKQYFEVTFPPLAKGALVEFLPLCRNGGHQVPAPETQEMVGSFRVRGEEPASPDEKPAVTAAPARYDFAQEYIATFSVFVHQPEQVGKTPAGVKVNWWVKSGSFRGPRLRGIVRPEGADWMTVRSDGIGIMDVRATLETHDGGLISSAYNGVFELGEDGYQNFLRGQYPKHPEARAAPRYLTSDVRYSWLNRVQCFSVGSINMATLNYVYDVYALR